MYPVHHCTNIVYRQYRMYLDVVIRWVHMKLKNLYTHKWHVYTMNRSYPSHPCIYDIVSYMHYKHQANVWIRNGLSFLGWYEIWFESIYMSMDLYTWLGDGFKYFCMLTLTWGNDPIWLTMFKGLKPPTSHIFYKLYAFQTSWSTSLTLDSTVLHWISHPNSFYWATRHSASTLVNLHKNFHSCWFYRQIKMICRDMPKPCHSRTKSIHVFQVSRIFV